jgi:aldose 1-epimerase
MSINRTFAICLLLPLLSLLSSCSGHKQETSNMKKSTFGKTQDGREVFVYTLKNRAGMEARITNYGGIVLSLLVPGRSGNLDDVVLGYESLGEYLKETPYFGALIGRYGNRIGKGKFTLNSVEYSLATNDGPNHLHGGRQQRWRGRVSRQS